MFTTGWGWRWEAQIGRARSDYLPGSTALRRSPCQRAGGHLAGPSTASGCWRAVELGACQAARGEVGAVGFRRRGGRIA